MTGPTTEPTRIELPPNGRSEPWERDQLARARVRGLLRDLPPGFVVFDALELPRPTRAVVDHLVVGPRNVWAVTTRVVGDPVTYGRGRNADTLWAGGTSLRTMLEAADWESAALADHIGFAVEPVICIDAPGLPEPAFDFHGIRICEPTALVRLVATSTADFVDVASVVDAVRRRFGAEPAEGTAPPRLGTAVHPPMLRRADHRRRRTLGARWYAFSSMRAVRVGVVIALAAIVVTSLPTIVAVWNSLAAESADRIVDVIDDEAGADPSIDPTGDRTEGAAVVSCPESGSGWVVEWSWPGPLGPGVVGYTITTRSDDSATVVHTPTPWSDPSAPPPAARLEDPAGTDVVIEHRAADGTVVATDTATIAPPPEPC